MLIHRIFTFTWKLLASSGVDLAHLPWVTTLTLAVSLAVVLWGVYTLLAGPVAKIINKIVDKTETQADDILLSPKIVRSLCLLATIGVAAYCLPRLTVCYPSMRHPLEIASRVMVILAVTRVLLLEANAFCVFLRHGDSRKSGILVLRNILTTTILALSALLTVSALLDRELAYVISALGAMAAVLMLVFKDSLLGMIAGIRLTVNGMLRENDWVSVPAYNADGRVEDVSLTAVKIRNWDKSVATIPPHALVSGGFVNRESMLSLGLRQIRRSILIDAASVGRLDSETMRRLASTHAIDIAGSPRVNLSLFRRHLRTALLDHPRRAADRDGIPLQVHVRELAPTPEGIPLEIFMFVDCPDWEEFEQLQGDIIDEAMAAVTEFGLRLYQKPAGSDFRDISVTETEKFNI